MSTKAGTIEVPGPPVGFRLWAAAVSVLAGAALIMSAVALTRAGRSVRPRGRQRSARRCGTRASSRRWQGRVLAETVGAEGSATLWDAGKLKRCRPSPCRDRRGRRVGHAVGRRQGRGDGRRVLAETVGAEGSATLWDAGKVEAMAGRVLAETVGAEGSATLWDAGKLEAMAGRVLAETVGAEGSATLWDAGKLEAMAGRVLAETVGAEGSATLWDAGKLEAMAGRVLAE